MDKDSRLSAAKKKLKQFQRKKTLKKTKTNQEAEKSAEVLDIRKSEEFIDEKFELLHCLDSSTTESTTKNILQVSAKLTNLAAEADMVIEDANTESSEETFENVDHPESYRFKMNELEIQNQELVTNLASTFREKKNLHVQCQQLTSQLHLLQQQIDEGRRNITESDEVVLREQLQVQTQTIAVLVSEKQDMHQQILHHQSKLEASALQHSKAQDVISSLNNKLDFYERDLQSKINALNEAEISNGNLQSECTSFEQKLNEMNKLLSNEQIRSTEFSDRFLMQQEELKKLRQSLLDAQEKVEMAEVLLSQMPAKSTLDSETDMLELHRQNEILTVKLEGYQDAFKEISSEREQFGIKYSDAQKKWEADLNQLQQKVASLQAENLLLSTKPDVSLLPSENDTKDREQQIFEEVGAVDSDVMYELDRLKTELEESAETNAAFQQQIKAQQNNIQHLSLLMQEKESCIVDLQNELENMKSFASEHENLLDITRDDKSTISRALSQNTQLKEQLGEIQDGFIRLSNDKMDLATKVSSLEHANKDLQTCLDKYMALYQQTKQDLAEKVNVIQTLQHNNANLQSQLLTSGENYAIANDRTEDSLHEQIIGNDLIHTHEESSEGDTDAATDEVATEHVAMSDNKEVFETAASMEEGDSQDSILLLTDKFTKVMKEKADLLNKLELLEHANAQLQSECDTIGEYIALYHQQRQTLKQRHKDKDKYISTITQEREAMQGKVEQLQTLIVAILNNKSADGGTNIDNSMSSLTHDVSFGSESENKPNLCNEHSDSPSKLNHLAAPQPDLVPKSDILLMAKSELQSSASEESSEVSSKTVSGAMEEKSAAAEQILTLLRQMQQPIDSKIMEEKGTPSAFCLRYSGPYTAI